MGTRSMTVNVRVNVMKQRGLALAKPRKSADRSNGAFSFNTRSRLTSVPV